jgi:uncharacterized protein YajQ (UPF0234 family)
MPSFDVQSEIDIHELTNAVDQANRELQQRFDFKDTGAVYELKAKEFTVQMKAEVEFKRGIDIACLDAKDPQTNLAEARQDVVLRHGIDADCGRKIVRLLKDSKLKVQAGIHGDKVRVTGKQRDELQSAIALLRKETFDRPISFGNFRD